MDEVLIVSSNSHQEAEKHFFFQNDKLLLQIKNKKDDEEKGQIKLLEDRLPSVDESVTWLESSGSRPEHTEKILYSCGVKKSALPKVTCKECPLKGHKWQLDIFRFNNHLFPPISSEI